MLISLLGSVVATLRYVNDGNVKTVSSRPESCYVSVLLSEFRGGTSNFDRVSVETYCYCYTTIHVIINRFQMSMLACPVLFWVS